MVRIQWRWNSLIGNVTFGAGKSWHWLQVGLTNSHQNYHQEKRKIFQTRNHDQLHFLFHYKMLSRRRCIVLKFCFYPTPSPPLSPWTDNDHAANQMRNTSKFRQFKSYWICCPFNWLETRKVWYITKRPRLIVKAKDSQISGIELRSCLG